MGAEACGCGTSPSSEITANMFQASTSNHAHWADAVKKNAIAAVQALHATDMDLIDMPCDINNICAVHVCVQMKHYEILDFLLEQRFDINVQDNKCGNTALHLAAMKEDAKAIEKLFSYDDIDDKVQNYEGQEPIYCCSTSFKRDYIKAKQRGKSISEKLRMTHDGIYNFNDRENETSRVNYLRLNNGYNSSHAHLNDKYRKKGKYITKFAMETGIDIDEMAMYLENSIDGDDDEESIWDILTNNKHVLKKDKDIEKLVKSICTMALEDKRKSESKNGHGHGSRNSYSYIVDGIPNKEAIHQLTERILIILKRDDGKLRLKQDDFEENFYNYLYQIHDDIVDS